MNSRMCYWVTACAVLLGGCAVPGLQTRDERIEPASPAEQLVARDFTHALSQLDDYAPSVTTIRLTEKDQTDTFLGAMIGALRDAGYAIRIVSDDDGPFLLHYRLDTEKPTGDARRRATYELEVGQVAMRREYGISASGGVAPTSPLYVRGADASAISLDESLFEGASPAKRPARRPPPPASVVSPELMAEAGPAGPDDRIERSPGSRNRLPGPEIATTHPTVARAAPTRARSLRPAPTVSLPGELIPKRERTKAGSLAADGRSDSPAQIGREANMFELGGSNFDAVFDSYRNIDEQVLVFPNDSLRLGNQNKRRVEALVDKFDPTRDVFSVVGCSLGPTSVAGGNAALALGRAGRVREALLFAGVAQDRILDEGCWAGDRAENTLPTRGVVVTLKRQKG